MQRVGLKQEGFRKILKHHLIVFKIVHVNSSASL